MTAEKPIIAELGRPVRPELQTPAKRFDLQDGLVIGGFVALEAGIAAIYWPAALIVAGLLAFGFAYLIERDRAMELKRTEVERLKEKHGSC